MLVSVVRSMEKVHGQTRDKKNLDLQSHLVPNAGLGSADKHPGLVRTSQGSRLC